jgi:hypothetical protein
VVGDPREKQQADEFTTECHITARVKNNFEKIASGGGGT